VVGIAGRGRTVYEILDCQRINARIVGITDLPGAGTEHEHRRKGRCFVAPTYLLWVVNAMVSDCRQWEMVVDC